MKCKTCIYFDEVSEHGGHCYRYPPTPIWQSSPTVQVNGCFTNVRPFVTEREFCGEHKELKDEDHSKT